MIQILKHKLLSVLQPEAADYIYMGYGIEARRERARRYWDMHTALCKDFQRNALQEYAPSGAVAVLGAGPLFDIDVELLKKKFQHIILCDANPALKSRWREVCPGAEYVTADLTGSISIWTEILIEKLHKIPSAENAAEVLRGLIPLRYTPAWKADVIYSVNLLSQIPVYWRDRVHRVIKKALALDTDENGNYAPALQDALEFSMRKLQEQHLAFLASQSPALIVLITDTEFLYYRQDLAEWQPEKALYLKDAIRFPGYDLQSQDGWFWHIAPQGIEYRDYGCIHNVAARCYSSAARRAAP